VTTNASGEFAGSDFVGGKTNNETKTLFRPSDIALGPDGALYVSDWYDPRVGGHSDLDQTCSGTIYRIAPKGFKPSVPTLDLTTTDGQIAALRSPAINARSLGFQALKANGDASVEAVAKLLSDPNPYMRGRAIHLLYQLGGKGVAAAGLPENQADAQLKIAAFRALRRASRPFFDSASALAKDADPAVRREAALAMRDQPFEVAKHVLVDVAKGYDGKDRSYLEAFGTGATGKEKEIYAAIKAELGDPSPTRWSNAFAGLAWRLHPSVAAVDFLVRAKSDKLTLEQRKQAVDSIAFVNTYGAALAMMEVSEIPALKAQAMWWLINRSSNDWREHDLRAVLKERGMYDPEKIELIEIVTPDPKTVEQKLNVAEVLKLEGDVARGKTTIMRCIMCHQAGGAGLDVGPTLESWGKTQTREVIANSIIHPSADISHGYDATELKTKDGKTIHGLLQSNGDPAIIVSLGGVTQLVPKDKIASSKPLERSLMLSGDQLGLTPQDVADLIAFLKAE
jgi:putative heme-binding domain-containing protein